MRRSLALLLAGALALGAAACGGDDDEPTTTEAGGPGFTAEAGGGTDPEGFVVALADVAEGDPQFPLTAAQARCMAEAIVGNLDVDALVDAGVTPEELAGSSLSPELAGQIDAGRDEIAADVAACQLSDVFATQFIDEFGLPKQAATCIADNVDDEEFATLLVGAFLGEQGSVEGEAFGRDLMAGLDGPCARVVVTELLASAGGGANDEQRACVAENLTEDLATRVLESAAAEDDAPEVRAEVEALIAGCV